MAAPISSPRIVEPEQLDSLPENHPAALANRRDLFRLNRVMGNFRWFARELSRLFPGPARFLELGAGDGALGRFLREAGGYRGWVIDGLDLWSRPPDWPAASQWFREDLVSSNRYQGYHAVLGNLILHQFENPVVTVVGCRIAEAGACLLLCEPLRHTRPAVLTRLIAPALHPVSRHDAAVSIRGGFRLGELPGILDWPGPVEESETWLGACRFLGQ